MKPIKSGIFQYSFSMTKGNNKIWLLVQILSHWKNNYKNLYHSHDSKAPKVHSERSRKVRETSYTARKIQTVHFRNNDFRGKALLCTDDICVFTLQQNRANSREGRDRNYTGHINQFLNAFYCIFIPKFIVVCVSKFDFFCTDQLPFTDFEVCRSLRVSFSLVKMLFTVQP